MNFSANLQFQPKRLKCPKPKAMLAIISLLASLGLTGCSDLSAKASNIANSHQSENMAQNTTVTLPNASTSEIQHPEIQNPAEKGSIWVGVANTMANMRCH